MEYKKARICFCFLITNGVAGSSHQCGFLFRYCGRRRCRWGGASSGDEPTADEFLPVSDLLHGTSQQNNVRMRPPGSKVVQRNATLLFVALAATLVISFVLLRCYKVLTWSQDAGLAARKLAWGRTDCWGGGSDSGFVTVVTSSGGVEVYTKSEVLTKTGTPEEFTLKLILRELTQEEIQALEDRDCLASMTGQKGDRIFFLKLRTEDLPPEQRILLKDDEEEAEALLKKALGADGGGGHAHGSPGGSSPPPQSPAPASPPASTAKPSPRMPPQRHLTRILIANKSSGTPSGSGKAGPPLPKHPKTRKTPPPVSPKPAVTTQKGAKAPGDRGAPGSGDLQASEGSPPSRPASPRPVPSTPRPFPAPSGPAGRLPAGFRPMGAAFRSVSKGRHGGDQGHGSIRRPSGTSPAPDDGPPLPPPPPESESGPSGLPTDDDSPLPPPPPPE